MIPERITTIEAVDMAKSIMEKAERQRAEFAQRVADAERSGCSCCDPTHDSPDPVVVRLEAEVERWKLNVADAQGRIRELHDDNTTLRGLLREACDAIAEYGMFDAGLNGEWHVKAQAALEGKL